MVVVVIRSSHEHGAPNEGFEIGFGRHRRRSGAFTLLWATANNVDANPGVRRSAAVGGGGGGSNSKAPQGEHARNSKGDSVCKSIQNPASAEIHA